MLLDSIEFEGIQLSNQNSPELRNCDIHLEMNLLEKKRISIKYPFNLLTWIYLNMMQLHIFLLQTKFPETIQMTINQLISSAYRFALWDFQSIQISCKRKKMIVRQHMRLFECFFYVYILKRHQSWQWNFEVFMCEHAIHSVRFMMSFPLEHVRVYAYIYVCVSISLFICLYLIIRWRL